VAYSSPEEETCHLIEGVSVVTDEDGVPTTLRAGDSFVIPKGFIGTREVLEPSRKLGFGTRLSSPHLPFTQPERLFFPYCGKKQTEYPVLFHHYFAYTYFI
jgi:hypothetical protein